MEEQLHPLAVTHLLQHTLRSLCIRDNSQWVYAVFWRILPRNYPPPKWDLPGSIYDRSRGNRRNWILVWEDGFCNFTASCGGEQSAVAGTDCEVQQPHLRGLQPELFFKMSHEIYNYGEGLIGKVAADHSHKWVFNEPQDQQDMSFLSAWHNPADSHPRTWEAQFQSGIKTIALIAVREGVVQLGAVNKVVEDLSYVVLLRKKFGYLETIPGVFLPHPSAAAAFPSSFKPDALGGLIHPPLPPMADSWSHHPVQQPPTPTDLNLYSHLCGQQMKMITPSMSSLEALLSKLPSVGPATPTSVSSSGYHDAGAPAMFISPQRTAAVEAVANGMMMPAKEESEGDEQGYRSGRGVATVLDHHHFPRGGESSSNSGSGEPPQPHSYYVNVSRPGEGF